MGIETPHDSIFGYTGRAARMASVGILVISVSLLLHVFPEVPDARGVHELVRKLYFFPILLSASWFGARGASAATAVATVACIGLFGGTWPGELGAQAGRVGEAGVFWLVGALSTSFFEQQRRNFREVEAANENTLIALASALDMREHDTGVHSLRVADYTVRLARQMGIRDPAQLETLWKGALLHDVGKIGIPDRVLLKPGPLTEEEWAVMRRHPEIGRSMLRKIPFLREASEIVYCHHERFDGSGYPRGLAGEAIPLGARIFAAVDVYDALTTERVYHGAASHDEGIAELRRGRGKKFDPAVVSAFERVPTEELVEIARRNEVAARAEPAGGKAWNRPVSFAPEGR
ncbi:MAG: hypothetical protein Kow00128_18860 [Deltaproteobacteria bacterium]